LSMCYYMCVWIVNMCMQRSRWWWMRKLRDKTCIFCSMVWTRFLDNWFLAMRGIPRWLSTLATAPRWMGDVKMELINIISLTISILLTLYIIYFWTKKVKTGKNRYIYEAYGMTIFLLFPFVCIFIYSILISILSRLIYYLWVPYYVLCCVIISSCGESFCLCLAQIEFFTQEFRKDRFGKVIRE